MPNPVEIVHSVLDIPQEVTAIIALGKQYGVDSIHKDILASPDHLSEDSRITVMGVGFTCMNAMERGQELRVLFTGNKKALFPGSAVEFMSKQFPKVPENWYDNPDEGSVTTMDSALRVPAILLSEGHSSAVLETVSFHAKRSRRQFTTTASKLIKCVAATDSLVAEQSEVGEKFETWSNSSRVKKERIKEKIAFVVEAGIIGSLGRKAVKAYRP
jgi:hypothetical protein